MCVMDQKRASRTAVFVCQGRAVADGRLAVRRFGDPIAARLLRPEELTDVELARSETNTSDWRRRLAVQALRVCAEVVVPRSVAIDDAVTAAANRQVVIVGAGLDSRPWRLDALPGASACDAGWSTRTTVAPGSASSRQGRESSPAPTITT